MVVAARAFTKMMGQSADKTLYQQKPNTDPFSGPVCPPQATLGYNKWMLLFRIWSPTLNVHELGQIGIETVCFGINIGKPIGYATKGEYPNENTSKVVSLEKLTEGENTLVCKAVTESGSVYQVVILKE